MDFNTFITSITNIGLTKGSIEKRCGYYSGKLTEIQKGRQSLTEEHLQKILKSLEQVVEELNLLIEEGSKLSAEDIKQYSVYEFTFPNNKKYYGISINPKLRWKDGNGYKNQEVGKAIQEFGWDNVEKRIIAENLTKQNATLIERTLIKGTGSDMPGFGYNVY